MIGWILYFKKGVEKFPFPSPAVNQLCKAAERRSISLNVVDPTQVDIVVNRDGGEVFINGEIATLPDFVVVRISTQMTISGRILLRQLEDRGVLTFNRLDGIELVSDKLRTIQILVKNHLPVPKTMILQFPVNINLIEKHL